MLVGLMFFLAGGRVGAAELFVSANISRVDLEMSGVDVDPKLARASVGVFLWEGVGFEFQGDFWNEQDDSNIGTSSEISKFKAAYLRLQSTTSEDYSAYVNLGYSQLSILTYPTLLPASIVKEDISSPIFVLGFQKFLDRFPNLSYSLSYEIMVEDDRVDMSALTFGYGYRFARKQ